MADLHDTNAATEEIYGPVFDGRCPVADEMIPQSSEQTAASAGKSHLSCLQWHYLLIRRFKVEGTTSRL